MCALSVLKSNISEVIDCLFQSLILRENAGPLPVHYRGRGELWELADSAACNPLDLFGHHPDP